MADDWIVSVEQLAQLLGVGRRQIYKLKEAGMPVVNRGKYHAPSVIRWFLDRDKESKAKDINEQRQMLYKAQTDKTELDVRITRGEVLEVGAVQTAFFSIGTVINTQIMAIEPRIARQFTPEQRDLIKAELSAALESIANEIEAVSNNRDDSGDHPATA